MDNNQYINNKKIVIKPWGKEIWLALNDKYCYKRIEINAGFKTSFQYHNFKLETNYIIKGTAEVWLENDNNIIETFIMNEGDFFTVLPPRKHRVIAITDVILQEVSTPEVDDVIRINDEYNRNNGKIEVEHLNPVVCILAAGYGSRLGNISKTTCKCLLPIKNKAVLSHIIEKFDINTDIVIAVGYLKDQIKEYVDLYHNDRKIKLIDVDNIDKGPAYSLLSCINELQRPFYFCVSDFYTESFIQDRVYINKNWINLHDTELSELYSTVSVINGKVMDIQNKNKNGYNKAFTGILYINDFKLFWDEFHKNIGNDYEIIDILKNIQLFNFEIKNIDWYDIGTLDLYNLLINKVEGSNLYLQNIKNEFKYIKDNIFIKKINNPIKIDNLIERSKYLEKYIPKILSKKKYFYSYEFFKGNTLYEYNNLDIYNNFIDWFEKHFVNITFKSSELIKNNTIDFYKNKTMARINLLSNVINNFDNIEYINNIKVKPIQHYIDNIDWNNLVNTTLTTELFHGDLQFDNIIYNSDLNEFKLIDWREDYGTNTQYGDLYYDIAKIYGGILLNYLKIRDSNNYSFKIIDKNTIRINNYIDDTLLKFLSNKFNQFFINNNLDVKKIKLLVALIYLNMAPLHINDFDKFLLCKSKLIFQELES